MDDMSVDIGEAEIPAGVSVGEVFVVEPHEVQDGGVEIVNVHLVFDRRETEFVG